MPDLSSDPTGSRLVSRDHLRRFSSKRDGPGLIHFSIQFTGLAISAWLSASFGASGDPMVWLAVMSSGIWALTFFPLLHEAGHQTAFRTRGLNECAVWLGALAMLQVPSFFREFHWEHHRSTQDRERDPEINPAPDMLDNWPTHLIVYLGLASGQFLMLGKAGFTIACALLPSSLWSKMFPFVRSQRRSRIAWESRLALLVLGAGIYWGIQLVPGFFYVILAWPLAHLLLGLYLMTEHTGLPSSGSQLERTRSVRSNPAVRWLMWNMPYHAEHHLHPSVPFHTLPQLERVLRPHLVHVSSSYGAFHLEALRRCFGAADGVVPEQVEP